MRELEDITTLSDSHKRYIDVSGYVSDAGPGKTVIADNLIYGDDYVMGFTGKYHCRECGCVQSGQSGDYHHNADCSHLVKEFSKNIPEPVFTPAATMLNFDECPATGIGHEYRVEFIPSDMDSGNDFGLHRRVIQCRYCGHELPPAEPFTAQIPEGVELRRLSDDQIVKLPPGYTYREVGKDDDGPQITARDLIICFALLVVAVMAILAHWIFGG